jgi:hypothetical protein
MYLGMVAFLTLLLSVFYAVAYSVFLGIYENYLRYYQKAELQWTGTASRFPRKRIRISLLIPFAFLSAWIIVQFVIMPD